MEEYEDFTLFNPYLAEFRKASGQANMGDIDFRDLGPNESYPSLVGMGPHTSDLLVDEQMPEGGEDTNYVLVSEDEPLAELFVPNDAGVAEVYQLVDEQSSIDNVELDNGIVDEGAYQFYAIPTNLDLEQVTVEEAQASGNDLFYSEPSNEDFDMENVYSELRNNLGSPALVGDMPVSNDLEFAISLKREESRQEKENNGLLSRITKL